MTAAPAKTKMPRTGCDGFIIVAVLWMLGALALLASIYATYVIDSAAGFAPYESRFRAEALATAAVELVAYQLMPAGAPHPSHGQFDFRMGQASISVTFSSEAARIDLNAAPKELLSGLFNVLGVESEQAQSYANRIISWRTAPAAGDDSEAAAYRHAGLKYAPRGARFPHVGELSLVVGLPARVIERALPFVTVYSGRAQINILDAEPEVIAALPGLTPDRLSTVLAARRSARADGQALLALLGPAQAHATVEASRASRVSIHIAFDNGRRANFEVVILVFEEGRDPYAVLSWREDDDTRAGHAKRTAVR
jgi:general secretion pathway protein K